MTLHFGIKWEENPNLKFYREIKIKIATTDDELEGRIMDDTDDII